MSDRRALSRIAWIAGIAWLALVLGAALPGFAGEPLVPGATVEGTVRPGQVSDHSLSLNAGQFVRIQLDQIDADLGLVVRYGDGSSYLTFDSAARPGISDFGYLLADSDRIFQLEVVDYDETGGAAYRLTASDARPAGEQERLRLRAERLFHEARDLRNSRRPENRAAARARFLDALPLMRSLGDQARQADCLIFTAGLFLADRQPAETLDLYREAIPLLEATGQSVRVGLTWTNLGWAYDNLADFSQALDAHERAQEIYRRAELRGAQAMGQSSLGRIYQRIGAYELALDRHRDSMNLWVANGWDGGQGVAWINIGRALDGGGDLNGAVDAFQQAWKIDSLSPRRRAQSALHLARAHRRLGLPGSAAEWLAQARSVYDQGGDQRGSAWCSIELGEQELAASDWQAASDAFQASADAFMQMEDPAGEAAGLFGMAHAERGAGRSARALDTLNRAIARIERTREGLKVDELRAVFLSSKRDYYDLRLQLMLDLGVPTNEDLFDATEQGRARALLDGLNASGVGIRASQLPEPAGLERIQALLGEDEALLSYIVAGDSVLVFFVGKSGVRWNRLEVPASTLTARVQNFVELLSADDGEERWRPIGVRLGRELLDPVAEALQPIRRLTVIPDGVLHFLPFEALPWEGDWFLRKMEIAYAPSATVFAELASREMTESVESRGETWIFAAPVFENSDVAPAATRRGWSLLRDDGFELAPLPFAAQEARDVAEILDDRRNLHLGTGATEARLKSADLSRAGLLHVATHGWISPRTAERSALILGAGEADQGEDGFLRPSEICKLRLSRPLVVLSACDSARGPILAAEGVQGLARGFLYAGAQSVVATLWSVRDESSARFMRAFYREIAAGHSPQAALREAKLQMLDHASTRSPRIWAAYVAIGHASQPISLAPDPASVSNAWLQPVALAGAVALAAFVLGTYFAVRRRKALTPPGARPAP